MQNIDQVYNFQVALRPDFQQDASCHPQTRNNSMGQGEAMEATVTSAQARRQQQFRRAQTEVLRCDTQMINVQHNSSTQPSINICPLAQLKPRRPS